VPDQSGTGMITGNNEFLPATVTWASNGNGEITFKDGSKLPFIDFMFDQI